LAAAVVLLSQQNNFTMPVLITRQQACMYVSCRFRSSYQ
jgi:hypothetical protein